MCQRTASILWLLVFFLFVGAPAASSQSLSQVEGTTGSISGVVSDQSGAIVAAAYVTATNMKSAQVFTARSGDDGKFAIQGLEFGDYEVKVSAPGFANSLMRLTITAESASAPHSAELQAIMGNVQITVAMHPGGETVNVCVVCGYTYFSLPFRSLPLIDRDPQKLIGLQSGVTEQSGVFSINGARPSDKTLLLDGFDDRNSRGGTFAAGISQDSVFEFNSAYYADTSVEPSYGVNRMPQLAAATNSGSNNVHGDLFWYGSRTGLNANGFFSNRGGVSDSTLYDQAGIAVGGPIGLPGVFDLRNHAFFFGSFERTRDDRSAGRQAIAPLPEFIDRTSAIQGPLFRSLVSRGAFRAPAGAPLRVADASVDGLPDIGDFVVLDVMGRRHNLAFGRVDVPAIQHINVTARYAVDQSRRTDDFNGDTFTPGSPLRSSAGASLLGLEVTQIISPATLQDIRFGYRSWRASTSGAGSDSVSIVALNTPVQIGAAAPEIPAGERGRAMFVADTISHVVGTHSLSAGGQIIKRNEDYLSGGLSGGAIYYSDLLALVTDGARSSGAPARSVIQVQTAGPNSQHYGPIDFYGFASDGWKPGTRTVVNFGLGYNLYSGALYEGARSAKRNFAPFISFARGLTTSEAVIIRGGASIVYAAPIVLPYNNIVTTPLYPLTGAFDRLRDLIGSPLPTGWITNTKAQTIEQDFGADMRPAYTESAFFSIQHSRGRLFVADVEYHMALARHLTTFSRTSGPVDPIAVSPNQPAAGPNFLVSSDGNSSYHSMQARVTSRERRGFIFEAHYTLSKSIDTVSADGPAVFRSLTPGPIYGGNSAVDRALSDFDRRHRAVGLFLWLSPEIKLPRALSPLINGWEVAGIVTIQAGPHVTLYSSGDFYGGQGDFNRDGIFNDRLAFLGRGPLASAVVGSSSPADLYFSPRLFGPPGSGYAALGRNSLPAPGYASIDLALQKNIHIKENRLELRVEAFNLTNRVNFAPPVTDLVSADFGRSPQASNARIVRLAARYRFRVGQ
jgi:hypothetical protein